MTNEIDIETYRTAAQSVARDNNAPVPVAIYAGAAAAAMRRSQLGGGNQFSPMLLDELTVDRLAYRAAVEVGPVGSLTLEQWVCDEWEGIAARATETVPPSRTDAEQMYHRATTELLIEADPDGGTATVAFAAALAVANIRWYTADSAPAATGFVSSVLAADPVAALARDQLDETTRASLAISVGNRWTKIMERVAVMEAVCGIEATAA